MENLTTIEDIKNMSFRTLQKNQYIFEVKDAEIFQSYNSIIAIKYNNGSIILDSDYWDYSKTTGKYRNIFLNEDKKQTEKKIKSGEYSLKKLN